MIYIVAGDHGYAYVAGPPAAKAALTSLARSPVTIFRRSTIATTYVTAELVSQFEALGWIWTYNAWVPEPDAAMYFLVQPITPPQSQLDFVYLPNATVNAFAEPLPVPRPPFRAVFVVAAPPGCVMLACNREQYPSVAAGLETIRQDYVIQRWSPTGLILEPLVPEPRPLRGLGWRPTPVSMFPLAENDDLTGVFELFTPEATGATVVAPETVLTEPAVLVWTPAKWLVPE